MLTYEKKENCEYRKFSLVQQRTVYRKRLFKQEKL